MKGFCGIWLVCLIWCVTPAGAGVVRNGSFEMDGAMYYITPEIRPEYWCDVSYDVAKFSAFLDDYWKTNGNYSLAMFTLSGKIYQPNDIATISQSVYFADASQIIFDLYLFASNGIWNPDVATARVLIDGNEVWNSDGLTFSDGQFEGEVAIDVNGIYKDENNHILSLQLGIDVNGTYPTQYYSQWDYVRFNYGCSGSLPGDFTGDCIVDINDLAFFVNGWLKPDGLDLTGDGVSNFADFAVFADFWGTYDDSGFAQPPQDNLLYADLNDDGIVDYVDIIMFSEDWLGDGGPCVRADLNDDGLVDFVDFSILAESWQQTGSLYGW